MIGADTVAGDDTGPACSESPHTSRLNVCRVTDCRRGRQRVVTRDVAGQEAEHGRDRETGLSCEIDQWPDARRKTFDILQKQICSFSKKLILVMNFRQC